MYWRDNSQSRLQHLLAKFETIFELKVYVKMYVSQEGL